MMAGCCLVPGDSMKYANGAVRAANALRLSAVLRVAAAVALGLTFTGAQGQGAYSFPGSTTVASAQSATVTVTVRKPGLVSAVQVLTQGAVGRDFTLDTAATPLGACTAGQ